jgi:hypothetical protein
MGLHREKIKHITLIKFPWLEFFLHYSATLSKSLNVFIYQFVYALNDNRKELGENGENNLGFESL